MFPEWPVRLRFQFIVTLIILPITIACSSSNRYRHNSGWGHGGGHQSLVLPKPTLIPRLKAAYLEGRHSVDVKGILRHVHHQGGRGWSHSPQNEGRKPSSPLVINGLVSPLLINLMSPLMSHSTAFLFYHRVGDQRQNTVLHILTTAFLQNQDMAFLLPMLGKLPMMNPLITFEPT